jgi:EmrB/QacA subfamily drug resistance transporter
MFEENRRTKLFTLGAICFGLFMVMLDNTVVNLALPTIARELNAGLSELQWIVDAFTLCLASLMLTGGTLGDLYGRKRAFIAGLIVFTGGSLLCALSPNIDVLIGARAVQGIGAAIMMPATLAILTNTFHDPRERAQAIGIWAGVSGIALALGPALGGIMVDAFGWQSIFYINVPIGIIALAITLRLVPESKNPEGRSLDIAGQILAVVGLACLTYAFIEANSYGWSSPTIISLIVVGLLALVVFGVWESRVKSPMLQLSFFRNLTFLGSNLVGLAVSFGFFGMIFFLGLYMQNVQGYTPTGAGVRQLASTLAVMVSAVLSGRIVARIGARIPIVIGMTLLGGCILAFTMVGADSHYYSYWPILTLMGIGVGLVMSPMTTAVMSTVPAARAGMASATLNTTRQVGGVFGIAVVGAIVTGRFISELRVALNGLNLSPAVTETIMQAARQGGTAGGGGGQSIPAPIHNAIRYSFTAGMHHALWFAGFVVLAGAVAAAIMIRGTAPHQQVARQTAADAAARAVAGRANAPAAPDPAGSPSAVLRDISD